MKKITISEVGPRDGFQNIPEFIPTEIKVNIIRELLASGLKKIQLTSFVSPKAIPQLRDAAEICAQILPQYPDAEFFALVPNLRGVADAWDCGIRSVAYVISVTESHNQANINRTREQSFADLAAIRSAYPHMHIALDMATAFVCPFEGTTPLAAVLADVARGYALGIREFNLCDTIGAASPTQIKAALDALIPSYSDVKFTVHIHDTRNAGILNTMTAIRCGVQEVQTCVGGLGGCPFAPGAAGNTATEDLVYLLNRMGFDTGIDFSRLMKAARLTKANVAGNYSSHQLNIAEEFCFC